MYYKRQNMPENENKEKVNIEIEMVSKEVTKIRNEIKLCNKIKIRVPEIKGQIKKIQVVIIIIKTGNLIFLTHIFLIWFKIFKFINLHFN